MKKIFSIVILIAALLGAAMIPAPQASASPAAVTFTVNSALDQPDDLTIPGTCHTAANTCTLRAAVMQANRSIGDATISLPSGVYILTIPASGTDGEENGDLNLTTPSAGNPIITLLGAGAASTIIDGNATDRVFNIAHLRTASIAGVTIRGGSIATGGGIQNSGTLTVGNSTISGNKAITIGGGIWNDFALTIRNSLISGNHGGLGGGIYSTHPLTITGSTISQNSADNNGGGIWNFSDLIMSNSTVSLNTATSFGGGISNSGPLEMSDSSIYGNSSTDGGGIYNSGSLVIWNSTLSGNQAGDSGGGIYNQQGTGNVYNVSIVGNGADNNRTGAGSAGGVYNNDALATFNLRNTLVAGNNVADSPIYDDCTGSLTSYGRNLFWFLTGCSVFNALGGNWTTLSALSSLGPLQNNGGPTWTVALLPGSNAIDGGDPVSGCIDFNAAPLATDQRGYPRSVGGGCDVGAFEYSPKTFGYLPFIVR